MQKKMTSYNDGILIVLKDKKRFNSFNAQNNALKLTDFIQLVSLFYSEVSRRQEDFLFAQSLGKKLTLKVKTPLIGSLKSNYKVLIDTTLYNVINLDFDKNNREMYFYLEEERQIER